MLKIGFIVSLCLLLWIICYCSTGTDEKNMFGFRSYPKEVQEIIRNDTKLKDLAPKEINMIKVLFSNIILFTIIFLIVGIIIKYTSGFQSDFETFVYFLILGETINAFDLLIIDLLWWRNTPRIRFSCALDKQLYQNPKVHIDSFLRGIIMYFGVALIVTGILMIFPK